MKKINIFILLIFLICPSQIYAKPILSEPINNQNVQDADIDFKWYESYNFPLGYASPTYSDLQISTQDINFDYGIIKNGWITGSRSSSELILNHRGQTLYWRVKGNYRNNVTYTNWSEWSDVGFFYAEKFPVTITANYNSSAFGAVQVRGELKGQWPRAEVSTVPLCCRDIYLQYFSGNEPINYSTIRVNNDGSYLFSFTPASTAYYQVNFPGDNNYKNATSSPILLTVVSPAPKPKVKVRVGSSFHKKKCKNKKFHSKHCKVSAKLKKKKNYKKLVTAAKQKHKKKCTKVIWK